MRKLYPNPSSSWLGTIGSEPTRLGGGLRFFFSLVAICLLFAGQTVASHFRYGNVSWRVVQSDPTKRTIEFKVTQAWEGSPALGEAPYSSVLNFGDRRTQSFSAPATFVNAEENYFFAQATFTHTYPMNGNFLVSMSSCCRIPTLVNNAGGSYYISTVVAAGNGNSSPASTLSPIVNMQVGMASASVKLPAFDPDGDPLTYSLATSADMNNIQFTNPAGLAIDPATGVLTLNTTTKTIGQLYNAAVKVSDGKTSIILDFLIKITPQSNAPQFDYSVTPANGYVYQVSPGNTLNFAVKATDNDPSDLVTLQGLGLPPGSKMSAPLPTTGNPVQSNFSWTPSLNNLGTHIINFAAQDALGAQTYSSITIQVSLRPTFDVPPTPLNGSTTQIKPGTPVQYTIQASDPDPNDRVQLVAALNLPSNATLSSALPTVAGNMTNTQLAWTPTVADWGKRTIKFTAADSYGERTDHSFNLVVNTPPIITSTPATSILAGRPYSYTVQVEDPDLPYGDKLKVLATTKPAWLTLTDNGNGTATLSGTPQEADGGAHSVVLLTEDKYHHGYDQRVSEQAFAIQVLVCDGSLAATSTLTVVSADKTYTGGVSTNFYLGYGSQSATLEASGGVNYAWSPAAGLSDPTIANPVFKATAPGTFIYTVTITNEIGCSTTKTVTLRVVDARCGNGNKNDKVLVCHNGHEICISVNAVPAHLNNDSHDDTLGSCLGMEVEENKASTKNNFNVKTEFEASPNPFATSTSIRFSTTQTTTAQVRVYDGHGTVVATLYDGVAEGGRGYTLNLDGRKLNAGIYLCQLVINGKSETLRLWLNK